MASKAYFFKKRRFGGGGGLQKDCLTTKKQKTSQRDASCIGLTLRRASLRGSRTQMIDHFESI